jgi:hypothetical protein
MDKGTKLVYTQVGNNLVLVNKLGVSDKTAPLDKEDWERIVSAVRAEGGHSVLLKHKGTPNPSLPPRSRAELQHSYAAQLARLSNDALIDAGVTEISLEHKPWCDGLNKRWNCNCHPVMTIVAYDKP